MELGLRVVRKIKWMHSCEGLHLVLARGKHMHGLLKEICNFLGNFSQSRSLNTSVYP